MADIGNKRPKTRKPIAAGRSSDQFPLRLPEGMRDQIKSLAEENGRSMNQEILEILREQFPDPPSDLELMDQLEVVLAWAGELKSANRRHALGAHLRTFIDEMKRRTPPADRTSPLVQLDRLTLDLVDDVCRYLDQGRFKRGDGLWERDEVVDNLVRMSLRRIMRNEENYKAFIWHTKDDVFDDTLVYEIVSKR